MNRSTRGCLLVLAIGCCALPALAETLSTFTLDALSFVSFQDEEVLALPAGSTIEFRFGDPDATGAVPFTIAPGGVDIDAIDLGGGRSLVYGLAAPASGSMQPVGEDRMIAFAATVSATLVEPAVNHAGTLTYAVPFTTETASATNLPGTAQVEVTGLRLVDGVWYAQIVGATVNKPDAFPKPGTAVYTVLSGSFDRLP